VLLHIAGTAKFAARMGGVLSFGEFSLDKCIDQ